MKHRILFVLSTFPALGGIEKLSLQLALAFRQEGHEVAFVSWKKAQTAWPDAETFTCYRLPNQRDINACENLSYLKQLICTQDFDIVLNQGVASLVYRLFDADAKHKVINVLHADPAWLFQRRRQMDFPVGAWRPSQWKSLLRYLYIKLFPSLSDKKVCRMLRDEIQQSAAYVLLHDSYKTHVLNALENAFALSAGERQSLSDKMFAISNPVAPSAVQTSAEKIILYTGRFSCKDKGLDILLRVWSKLAALLPDWKLHLRGDGPDKAKLEQMILREKLPRVSILPPIWDESLYAQAAVFALPSRTEAQGLSQMEAQQAGLVPVLFRLNDMMEEMLQNGQSGLLVSCFDEDAYADALLRLCRDEALRCDMSQRAQAHMKNYTIERILPFWLRLFDDLSSGFSQL